jgi:hypothetical protein
VRKIVISGLLALIALAVAGGNALPAATAATAAPLAPRQQGITASAFIISGKISCGTPNSCLAVAGDANKSGQLAQVVEGWNGKAWRSVAVPTPNPTVALINLAAVSCRSATACVVVGTYVTLAGVGAEQPYALTWNGSSLTPTGTPPVPKNSGSTSLTGVSCVTARSCVAVGDSQGGDGPLLVETWNGAKWTLRTARVPGGARATYPAAVSCRSVTFCIVAGQSYSSVPGTPAMLLARWNGTSLTAMKPAVPADAADITLSDISCPSATFCAAVGFSTNPSGTGVFGLAAVWNGKSWTADKMAAPKGDAESFLYGVSCRPDGFCMAVGSAGLSTTATEATALSYKGKKWTLQNVPGPGTGPSSDFFGVNCLLDDKCVAIGEIVSSHTATAAPLAGLWNGSSWRLSPA